MGFWDKVKDGFKDEVNKAKLSAFDKKMDLDYIGGLPGVKGKEVEIVKNTHTGEFKIGGRILQLRGIQWQEAASRSAGKAAAGAIIGGALTGGIGAVAGAIIGGALTGGIGAVAGAAIGGRKRDRSQAVISVADGDKEYSVYVRCGEDEFRELTAYLE